MMRVGLLVITAIIGWYLLYPAPAKHWPPGMLVTGEPLQQPVNAPTIRQGDYTITPLASYALDARVLSTRTYSDDLAPEDLALGWQQMSDSAVLSKLDITQYGRFYHYQWYDGPPIDPHIIVTTSANTHILPANDTVRQTLKHIHTGDVVRIRGFLVHVSRTDGWQWQSSMTRADQGDGACEVVWTESLEVLR